MLLSLPSNTAAELSQGKSRAIFSFFTPKTPKMWDTNTFRKPGPSCNAVPMFPVLHDYMDQVSWQKRSDMASAVWMREVEMILSLLLNTSDWRVWGQTAVSLFAPSCQAQLCMASNTSETRDTTLQLATKGLLASGALQREPSCLFWDTSEASPCLHMEDIPEQSFPAPLRMGSLPTMLIKHSDGSYPLHPRAACTLPALATPLHGQLDKPRSWAIPGKGILFTNVHSTCSLVHCIIIHSFNRKRHCSLWYKTKSGEPVNLFLQQLHFKPDFLKILISDRLEPIVLHSFFSVSTLQPRDETILARCLADPTAKPEG